MTADPHAENLRQAAERFATETEHHKLTILHDDGLYRHLRFMSEPPGQPKQSGYWFELITVPGSLIFRGDGESFVFARLRDMFEFFRSNPDRNTMRVSPDYWAEKLTSNRAAAKTYSREKFDQIVAEALKDAEEQWPGITAAWDRHASEDNLDYGLDHEGSAREALRDFEFGALAVATCRCGERIEVDFGDLIPAEWRDKHPSRDTAHAYALDRVPGFRFEDTYEWDLQDFDWWYLWSCHAIAWGIARYDEARSQGVAKSAPVMVTVEPAGGVL